MANTCRYLAVQQNVGRAGLEVETREARFVYTVTEPSIQVHRQHSEGFLAMVVRACREGTGDAGWTPREVCFQHRAWPSIREQEHFFACPVRYGQRHDAVVLAPSALPRPFRTADPELLPALLGHAEACLARLGRSDDFLASVRRVVVERLRDGGEVSVVEVARHLGTSPRSVQRRLASQRRSFAEVVGEARLGLARRYLADPSLSLTDAAFLLGYSQLSAFSRAFRRWTGQSALDFRRSRGGQR
jgi:AraC-like DNA-binding protein